MGRNPHLCFVERTELGQAVAAAALHAAHPQTVLMLRQTGEASAAALSEPQRQGLEEVPLVVTVLASVHQNCPRGCEPLTRRPCVVQMKQYQYRSRLRRLCLPLPRHYPKAQAALAGQSNLLRRAMGG